MKSFTGTVAERQYTGKNNKIFVHHNLPWYFTACECLNCLIGCWVCGILLDVGKGVNVINK
jgi:hypothetical protein